MQAFTFAATRVPTNTLPLISGDVVSPCFWRKRFCFFNCANKVGKLVSVAANDLNTFPQRLGRFLFFIVLAASAGPF